MTQLVTLVRWEICLGLVGIIAIVAYQLLTGRINAKGLLFDSRSGNFDPGRVQFLVITLFAAFNYLLNFAEQPTHLPSLSPELLAVFGGSGLVYLGNKAAALLNLPRLLGRDDSTP